MYGLQQAIRFIRQNGSPVEQARLDVLIGKPRPIEALRQFMVSQRGDGGWAPFWAGDYSSLDATCFHLAQAQQLAIHVNEPPFENGLRFLAERQRDDRSWEEDPSVADQAPPWAKPGELPAHLYLTANCAFWLAASPVFLDSALQGARYLSAYLDENGKLPSFLHTHWLCGGLWGRLGMVDETGRVLACLAGNMAGLSACQLAWMVTALRITGLPTEDALIQSAIPTLVSSQQEDGRWASDDGPAFDVHATLETLYALKLCGIIDPDQFIGEEESKIPPILNN
jgi:hypothetical protein